MSDSDLPVGLNPNYNLLVFLGCTRGDKRGDFLWMEKIMRTGTLPDKMAAFAVKIQDSPVHNLSCLQQLIGMVKTQGKQQCLMTAGYCF